MVVVATSVQEKAAFILAVSSVSACLMSWLCLNVKVYGFQTFQVWLLMIRLLSCVTAVVMILSERVRSSCCSNVCKRWKKLPLVCSSGCPVSGYRLLED